ncbi:MAG: methyltransferase [Promicromonosporaceae bacterium]|nr:methyltransferase [Promicromonosporaceae bacterium]
MPLLADLNLIAALRADLQGAGYTTDAVAALLGPVAADALEREQVLPARRVTERLLAGSAGPTPNPPAGAASSSSAGERRLAVLVRLLMLGCSVPEDDVAAALPTLTVSGGTKLGLWELSSDDQTEGQAKSQAKSLIKALVEVLPYHATDAGGEINWWFASDLSELASGKEVRNDYVLGVGGASQMLAQITIREPVVRVLDLGTGCGIQALHATRHLAVGSDDARPSTHAERPRVVATDVSERALAFARFNALLNLGPGHPIEFRLGSMLEPVAGEAFDLIVSNPPFVITPRVGAAGRAVAEAIGDFEYRDGGRSGDDLVRDLFTDVGQHLNPGGVAQFLANWEHRRDQAWQERIATWLDEAGSLDAWVIQRETLDPAHYAETWLRDGGTTEDRDAAAFTKAYGAYLDDFEAREVEAIGFGIVTLRKVVGQKPVRRLEEHGGALRQPLGQHLSQALRAIAWLREHDDDALLATHLVRAADVTEERFYTPGAADPNVIIIRQGDGLLRGVQASSPLAALVGACDGDLSAGDLIGGIAHYFDVDQQALTAELLPAARRLVRDGFLNYPSSSQSTT